MPVDLLTLVDNDVVNDSTLIAFAVALTKVGSSHHPIHFTLKCPTQSSSSAAVTK